MLKSVDSDKPVQPPFKLTNVETPNAVYSGAKQSYSIHATSKGSDKTARMRRLV